MSTAVLDDLVLAMAAETPHILGNLMINAYILGNSRNNPEFYAKPESLRAESRAKDHKDLFHFMLWLHEQFRRIKYDTIRQILLELAYWLDLLPFTTGNKYAPDLCCPARYVC